VNAKSVSPTLRGRPETVRGDPSTPAQEPGEATELGAAADSGLRLLVESLVRGAIEARVGEQPTGRHGGREVLLDLEVEGVRCTLVRRERRRPPRAAQLSPRERDIARMVAQGYPNKVIASVLEISVWTVSTHLRRIFAKLGVTSRAAMVARLIEAGEIG
jgi:DNA-binding CsgD family transcriptional regulator